MKNLLFSLTLVFCAVVAVAQETPPAEMAAARATLDTALSTLAADTGKYAAALDKWYADALDLITADRAKAGDLDGTLAVKEERTRVAAHTAPTDEQFRAMPDALRKVRTTYEATVKHAAEDAAQRKESASRQYLADLDALQKSLTQKNQIDQALLVRAEKDRYAASLTAPAAPTAPTKPTPPTAPAATPPPATPPPIAKATPPPAPPEPEGAPLAAMAGTWKFSEVDGKRHEQRYLAPDGKLTGEHFVGVGHWKLVKDERILLFYPDGGMEVMLPPFDPTATMVNGKQVKTWLAVRQAEGVPFPQAKPPTDAEAATVAAVQDLIGGSRWDWVGGQNIEAPTKNWQEFYPDGTGATSWNRKIQWEVVPPNVLHIYDAYDNRHTFMDIDATKRQGFKDARLEKNDACMRYAKHVDTPTRNK